MDPTMLFYTVPLTISFTHSFLGTPGKQSGLGRAQFYLPPIVLPTPRRRFHPPPPRAAQPGEREAPLRRRLSAPVPPRFLGSVVRILLAATFWRQNDLLTFVPGQTIAFVNLWMRAFMHSGHQRFSARIVRFKRKGSCGKQKVLLRKWVKCKIICKPFRITNVVAVFRAFNAFQLLSPYPFGTDSLHIHSFTGRFPYELMC